MKLIFAIALLISSLAHAQFLTEISNRDERIYFLNLIISSYESRKAPQNHCFVSNIHKGSNGLIDAMHLNVFQNISRGNSDSHGNSAVIENRDFNVDSFAQNHYGQFLADEAHHVIFITSWSPNDYGIEKASYITAIFSRKFATLVDLRFHDRGFVSGLAEDDYSCLMTSN